MVQDSDKKPDFEFGNHTDVGKVRSQNEDYMGYFNTLNGHLFVVCDGMGGHVGGSVASQMAVQSIRDYAQQQYYPNPTDVLAGALRYANHRIYQEAQIRPELFGMGTTCVVVILRGKFAYYAHVGDSRIYLYRNYLQRITKDHSFVQTLIDQGVIREEEAVHHPRKNEILRALGIHYEVEAEVAPEPIITQAGDVLLLCTDGLTDMVSEYKITDFLANSDMSSQHKAMNLVQAANDFGGQDNITAQIISFLKDTLGGTSSLSDTNPFQTEKRTTQINTPIAENSIEHNFMSQNTSSQKKNETPNEERKKFSIPALFILALVAAGVAYLYFHPDSPLMERLAVKRDKIIHKEKNPSDSTRVGQKVKRKAYELIAKEFPILESVTEKYKKAKEKIQQVKDFKNKAKELLTRWDSVAFHRVRRDESIEEVAERYNISPETLLEANEINTDEELQNLDTLLIPLEK